MAVEEGGHGVRRVLILHVGPHKTGTTYIQKRLVEDRELLRERLRLVYPRTGQTVLFGHHALVPLFRDAAGGSTVLRELSEELRPARIGLLSSEEFSKLENADFVRVREHFADCDIRVVAYLRVRSELLVSRWGESIKHGADHSFPEYLAKVLAAPDSSPVINQGKLLDTMASVFGRASLQILIYRRDVDLYAEFVERVLGADSFAGASAGRNETVNGALPVHATECLRLLNNAARQGGLLDRTYMPGRFMERYGRGELAAELDLFRRAFDAQASVMTIAGVDALFEPLDRAVMERYVNGCREDRLPETRTPEVRYLRDLDATADGELKEIVARVHRIITS
jgi:hypothetical protein